MENNNKEYIKNGVVVGGGLILARELYHHVIEPLLAMLFDLLHSC